MSDETTTNWHILVKTEGGTVSLLKNMDAPTARQVYENLAPRHFEGMRLVQKSDVRSLEVIGPEGVDLWEGSPKSDASTSCQA